MTKRILAIVAGAILILGLLLARSFTRGGHPYAGELVTFVLGVGVGWLVIPLLRDSVKKPS